MPRVVAALMLMLVLAPALAAEKTLLVSATVLDRNACSLTQGNAGMRCTGSDAKVAYRVSTGAERSTPVSSLAEVARGKTSTVKAAAGDVTTIEF